MYLVKCDKCGNLVEVKTEFLMLCPQCKQKLKNNFQEWHALKGNHEKNFNDYLEEECVSSERLEEMQREERLMQLYSPKKNKRRKVLNIAVAVLAFLLSLVAVQVMAGMISEISHRTLLYIINGAIGFAAALWAIIFTLRRKKFQSFTPVFISVAGLALAVVVEMTFLVATGNL